MKTLGHDKELVIAMVGRPCKHIQTYTNLADTVLTNTDADDALMDKYR